MEKKNKYESLNKVKPYCRGCKYYYGMLQYCSKHDTWTRNDIHGCDCYELRKK